MLSMLGNFIKMLLFCHLLLLLFYIFSKFTSSKRNIVSLISVQTVCHGYQQTTKVPCGGERVK